MAQGTNICPLDGRYRKATEDIRRVWGDSHLMRYRVYLEVSCRERFRVRISSVQMSKSKEGFRDCVLLQLKWLEFFLDHVHPKGPLTAEQRRAASHAVAHEC